MFISFSAGTVFMRQNLTSVDIKAVDPYHRYANKAERANQDIYDEIKLKNNNFGLHGLFKNISAL